MKNASRAVLRQTGRRALSGKMTTAEKVMFDCGPTNAEPGTKYMLNVPNPEEPVPESLLSGDFQRAWVAGHAADGELPADNDLQRDAMQLRKNPPFNYLDRCYNAYHMGSVWGQAGGSLDPLLKATYSFNHGIAFAHASYFNEKASELVKLTFDSGKVEHGSMYQPLTCTSGKTTRMIQAPFTAERADQGFTELPIVAGGEESSDLSQGSKLREEINWHFSTVGAAFITQGSVGSCNDDEVRVQVISDNPAHALFWNKIMHEMPSRGAWAMNTFAPPVRLYHASAYQFENERVIEEYGGPKPKDFGLEHNQFVYIDAYSKPAAAMIGGDISIETGRNVLAYLASVVLQEELETAVIPADAVMDPATGVVTVHITEDAAARDAIRADPNLFGAHHLTLSPDGLGRVWDGVTHTMAAGANPGAHNLVTTADGGKTHQLTKSLDKRIGDPTSSRKDRNYHADFATDLSESKRYASVDAMEGMTLKPSKAKKAAVVHRPNTVTYDKVKFVFSGAKAGPLTADAAAQAVVDAVKASGFAYASDDALKGTIMQSFAGGAKASSVAAAPAASTAAKKGKKK